MPELSRFFVDGAWVAPLASRTIDVIDPSTEEPVATVALGGSADIDRAVAAAVAAFPAFARTTRAERIDLLRRILQAYRDRFEDLAQAMSREMGAPIAMSRAEQAACGVAHIEETIRVLESFHFDEPLGSTHVFREPIGVCGMITPWNWPMNQIASKVAPALAAGCTMVLKPSELAPINAVIFAEVMEAAGVPRGVFNLVNGEGSAAGDALARHPDVAMISFTGSTRAGIAVARAAADTVKRVHQELGGKSANVILPDADLPRAVAQGVRGCFGNSGQSCNAPTRMLVPRARYEEAVEVARDAARGFVVGPAFDPATMLGPVANRPQYDKVQAMIEGGIREGSRLVAGGPGRPDGLNRGFFVRPTVFAATQRSATIANEEIFGPVLTILAYRDEDDAAELANGTVYGLAAHVQSGDHAHALRFAARMRAGQVFVNYAPWDPAAPFGGYKQSGNGRERGRFGLEEFTEIKAIMGYHAR